MGSNTGLSSSLQHRWRQSRARWSIPATVARKRRGGRDRRRDAGPGPADGAERRAMATSSESGGTAELVAAATERAESGFASGDAAGDGFHGQR